MVRIKKRSLNIFVQAEKIRSQFPDSKVTVNHNKLVWKYTLSPTPLSDSYDIRLEYVDGNHPNVYVINRKLELYHGLNALPHVYDTEKQRLCLYYKIAHEWDPHMFLTDTVIPWISEWLYFYEFWLATGKWYGRGIHGKSKPFEKK